MKGVTFFTMKFITTKCMLIVRAIYCKKYIGIYYVFVQGTRKYWVVHKLH